MLPPAVRDEKSYAFIYKSKKKYTPRKGDDAEIINHKQRLVEQPWDVEARIYLAEHFERIGRHREAAAEYMVLTHVVEENRISEMRRRYHLSKKMAKP